MTKLTLADIADLRAYERERESFRTEVIALKKRRRVSVGPFVSLLFENRDTVRFQIQEMARVERILTDEGIQTELDIYNPLIPEPGALCATLFVELTSDEELRTWLPRLVGIERSVELRLVDGTVMRAVPAAQHDAHLTRETITASVHYLTFAATPAQVAAFGAGARLAIDHANYLYEVELLEATIGEMVSDLRGT
jgi:hypothetical protein